MIKKISLYIIAVILPAMIAVSCSKEEPAPTPGSDEINYLVMWYAVGGRNLDDAQMANILQALDYGSTDKVKMTFQYKLSRKSSMAPFQDDERFKNFNGTRRLTSDQNTHLKGKIEKESLKAFLNVNDIEELCNSVKSECIGDTSYVMSSDTALTSFINWSRALYPTARNLILVLGDHGSGWSLRTDGRYDSTKSIESDDNITRNVPLTAKGVERGVKSSSAQRVKMIYTDACLMSVHENFQTYAKVTDYALSAVEYTPGRGGNYYVLLDALNAATCDDTGLWNTCKTYIDYLNTQWWSVNGYYDLGIYDLRKNSSLTAVCKSISEKLVSCWKDGQAITPEGSMLLWKDYIRYAVSRCELCVSGTSINEKYIPDTIKPYLEQAGVKPDTQGRYDGNEVLDWLLGDSKSLEDARQADPAGMRKMQEYVEARSHEEYCLADLLLVLNKSLKEAGLSDDKNPFIKLRSDYISTLKDASYINCTRKTSDADYAYEHCGPGIFLFTFNSSSWGKGYEYYFKFGRLKLDNAISYYEASDFDEATSWSEFLKLNDVTPSLITNPTRRKNTPNE